MYKFLLRSLVVCLASSSGASITIICQVCTLLILFVSVCYLAVSLAYISSPAAGCGSPPLPTRCTTHHHHHSSRHPDLLADSHAVIVCFPLQVRYGLIGMGGYR